MFSNGLNRRRRRTLYNSRAEAPNVLIIRYEDMHEHSRKPFRVRINLINELRNPDHFKKAIKLS